MFGRACVICLLSLPLLAASGPSAHSGAAYAAAVDLTTPQICIEADTPWIESPCFRNSGAEAWTCNTDGVTLSRTRAGATEAVHCPHGCVPLPGGFDSQCRPRDGALGSTVNGHAMTAHQARWVNYFAWCAVPMLQGTRDVRLTAASIVAWWGLKEGVLDASHADPVGLSLCRHNHPIGPLERCAVGSAWQVGASGIQASCCKLSKVEGTAARLFPAWTETELLSGAAVEAGYPVGSAENARIVDSTGPQRASWLLHVTAIGFFHQEPIVIDECITKSKSWCYGAGWPASAAYAPNKPSAMRAIGDLRAILDTLSP